MTRHIAKAGLPVLTFALTVGATAAQAVEPPTFSQVLADQYSALAAQEHSRQVPILAEHFLRKSDAAKLHTAVQPDTLDRWADSPNEAVSARSILNEILATALPQTEPEVTAAAQVRFDCWLGRDAIGDRDGATLCRKEMFSAIRFLQANHPTLLLPTTMTAIDQAMVDPKTGKPVHGINVSGPGRHDANRAYGNSRVADPNLAPTIRSADKPIVPELAPTPALSALESAGVANIGPADVLYTKTVPMPEWKAYEGRTLRQVLESWAAEAGWEVRWESEYEYPLHASATYRGEFTEVVSELLKNFETASPPVVGTAYENHVIVVKNLKDRIYD